MKYILFDLDGTLTESGIGIKRSVQYALKNFNIDETDDEKLRLFIGPPLFDSFTNRYGLNEEQANKAIELYRERYREKGIFENRLYDGIKNMLSELKARDLILAVASSKPEVFVIKILKFFDIDKYFSVITGASLDGKLSAKKDVIRKTLEMLNATNNKDQCIMIGDREHDVKGAIENSINCIGCLWGYGSENELKKAGCSILVSTPDQITSIL
ncbi:HAD family hydrolase [Succinivibrio faecicola]|uniref:HAD family hydrolase n=1 Tax=Succinivibrio faecicola TaxID=2820300 RepID=A0ABS7DGA0_9GAMM|nr:HAD family hydrolase [Succinivibrio faecicola]MBW7570089.1 HAD family hydrolase [Succinivibrio faecicola]